MVSVCTKGKTRDKELGIILWEIPMVAAIKKIELRVKHVEGKQNDYTDALSRVHMSKCSWVEMFMERGCVRREVSDEEFVFYKMLM